MDFHRDLWNVFDNLLCVRNAPNIVAPKIRTVPSIKVTIISNESNIVVSPKIPEKLADVSTFSYERTFAGAKFVFLN